MLNYIWKSRCLPKLKVFLWLLLKDRLNTKDLMVRKHWHVEGGHSCVLCDDDVLETRDQLFFTCPFANRCWDTIHIDFENIGHIHSRILKTKSDFTGPCFMEIFATAAWNIWKARNELIFQGLQASLSRWRIHFQSDLLLHQHRVKTALVQPLLEWVQNNFT